MLYSPLPPFAAWAGPRDASLVIVGEAWGRHEAELRKPFVGESGKLLFEILGEAFAEVSPELYREITGVFKYGLAWVGRREAWLHEASIAFTNVINLQPYGNKIPELCVKKGELPQDYDWPAIEKSYYLDPQYLPEITRLKQELEECRPNLVIAAGAKASWALLRSTKISSIRGAIAPASLVEGLKILPTYHPAALMRQWAWRPIVVADLMKAKREREFAEFRRPSRNILFNPTIEEVEQWTAETLSQQDVALLASDTETAKGQITMISFARSIDNAMVIPFWDKTKPGWSYWTHSEELEAWNCVEQLLTKCRIVWQNGLYDLQYVIPMAIASRADDDTMLLHHSILPEMQKGLGFLGSVYTSEPAWKLMRTTKTDTVKRDE